MSTQVETNVTITKSAFSRSVDSRPTPTPFRERSLLRGTLRHCLLRACGVKERLPKSSGLLLTFDDGPDPEITPAVLELLAQYQARAVFFVVGNRIQRAPHMLAKILAEGHIIGNHTFLHPLDRIPALAEYYRDIKNCQDLLESITGHRPHLFRPPLGAITFASLTAPRLCRLRTLLWSIDVGDWKLRQDDEAVQAGHRLANSVGLGDIVLLHDDNPRVITLLETALSKIRERGFSLSDAACQLSATTG